MNAINQPENSQLNSIFNFDVLMKSAHSVGAEKNKVYMIKLKELFPVFLVSNVTILLKKASGMIDCFKIA